MIIADPSFVAAHREMFDTDVAQISLQDCLPRPRAYLKYASITFGVRLVVSHSGNGWWSCLAIENKYFDKKEIESAQAFKEIKQLAALILKSTIVARDPETAVIACLLRHTDPAAPIALPPTAVPQFYGHSTWYELAEIKPIPGLPSPGESAQPMLFESARDTSMRLEQAQLAQEIRFQLTTHLVRRNTDSD